MRPTCPSSSRGRCSGNGLRKALRYALFQLLIYNSHLSPTSFESARPHTSASISSLFTEFNRKRSIPINIRGPMMDRSCNFWDILVCRLVLSFLVFHIESLWGYSTYSIHAIHTKPGHRIAAVSTRILPHPRNRWHEGWNANICREPMGHTRRGREIRSMADRDHFALSTRQPILNSSRPRLS